MEQPFSNCWQVIMSHECNACDAMFLKFKRPEHLKTHLSLVLKNLFFYCRFSSLEIQGHVKPMSNYKRIDCIYLPEQDHSATQVIV